MRLYELSRHSNTTREMPTLRMSAHHAFLDMCSPLKKHLKAVSFMHLLSLLVVELELSKIEIWPHAEHHSSVKYDRASRTMNLLMWLTFDHKFIYHFRNGVPCSNRAAVSMRRRSLTPDRDRAFDCPASSCGNDATRVFANEIHGWVFDVADRGIMEMVKYGISHSRPIPHIADSLSDGLGVSNGERWFPVPSLLVIVIFVFIAVLRLISIVSDRLFNGLVEESLRNRQRFHGCGLIGCPECVHESTGFNESGKAIQSNELQFSLLPQLSHFLEPWNVAPSSSLEAKAMRVETNSMWLAFHRTGGKWNSHCQSPQLSHCPTASMANHWIALSPLFAAKDEGTSRDWGNEQLQVNVNDPFWSMQFKQSNTAFDNGFRHRWRGSFVHQDQSDSRMHFHGMHSCCCLRSNWSKYEWNGSRKSVWTTHDNKSHLNNSELATVPIHCSAYYPLWTQNSRYGDMVLATIAGRAVQMRKSCRWTLSKWNGLRSVFKHQVR